MDNSVKEAAIKKLKLLFTVVDRNKGEFYADVIGEFGVNCQLGIAGKGTASSELLQLLGLNNHKAVILSVVREDQVEQILNCLEDKFASVKGGRGVSFAVPMSSVMGVNLYQFLSDNRMGKG